MLAIAGAGERLYTTAFVQTPHSPLIRAVVFKLTGGYYLFSAKLVNFTFLAFAAGCSGLPAAARTTPFSAVVVLFLANYYLLRAAIEASNYPYPSPLPGGLCPVPALLTAALSARLLAAGVAGCAVGAGLTTQLPWRPSPRLRCLSRRKPVQPHHRRVLPLAGGTAAGARPALLRRDWERFAFNNLATTCSTRPGEQSGFAPMTWEPCWVQPATSQPQLLAAGRPSGAGSRHPAHRKAAPASPAPARADITLGAAGCGLHRDGLHAAAALPQYCHARFSCSRWLALCSHRPAAAGDVATPDADRCCTAYARRTVGYTGCWRVLQPDDRWA